MGVADALSKKSIRMDEERAKRARDFYMEEEETLMYLTKERRESLNKVGSAFKSETYRGINSQQSIFDKQSIFKTGK